MTFTKNSLQSRPEFERYCKQSAVRTPVSVAGVQYARILHDQMIAVDMEDKDITPWLVSDGFWESWVSLFVARNVKPGDVCLDIGANQGYYSLLMRKCAGAEGKVIAVDANKKLCELLAKSFTAGGYTNTSVLNYAMSNKSNETVTLHGIDGHDGISTISGPVEFAGEAYSIDVLTLALDDLQELDRVDLIKVDIEGAEHKFLLGARETIKRNPDIKIVMEFTPRRYESVPKFIEDISEFDLEINKIDTDGSVKHIPKDELLKSPSNGYYDILLSRR